jgi:putative transposase
VGRIQIKEKEKFQIIYKMIQRKNNRLNISYMCKVADVSRSGYYNYVKNLTSQTYLNKEKSDKSDFEDILTAYNYKNRYKGARGIKMCLERDFGIIMNLKKIRRLMKKYGLKCPIRKANPYRRMAKAMKTNNIAPNLLERHFYNGNPFENLLTDISYLYYGPRRDLAYISTIKDSVTREILAYQVSDSLELKFVENTVEMLVNRSDVILTENTLLHSDQGVHYTSNIYQKLLKDFHITQSMSRRGNCWDNAPQESYFGHMKDELHLKGCLDFKDLQNEINDYIYYYNNERYQWDLGKRTPTEYRRYLLEGGVPLLHPKEKTDCTNIQSV